MSETKPTEPAAPADKKGAPSGPTAPPSILTKPSDHALRPGFRNPSNKGTKLQKGGKKK